jgi:hypothetical protein
MTIRSIQRASIAGVATLLASLVLGACSQSKPEAPAPAEQAAPATPAPSEPAPMPAPRAEREPTPDELPVQEDFQAEADQQITASNLKTELDDLQKQIDGTAK